MCLGPEILAIIGAVTTVTAAAGTGYSVYQGQQAAAASKKAEQLRKRQFQLQQLNDRRKAIRDYQLRRATSVSNIQGATGSLDNSATGGALSALSSTLGTQLGELQQSSNIGNALFNANADYAQASANAQAGAQVAGFGKEVFGSRDEIGRIGATLFG